VWTAYSNLTTAFRQRQTALALLQASTQSYNAALESYSNGVRNLLDVTAAQRTLAQAMAHDRMADRWNADESAQKDDLTSAYAQLEQATWKAPPKEQHELVPQLTPKIKSFLLLSRRIATLADRLQTEM
jgi:hypothetical protein